MVEVTNPDRLVFPATGHTKAEVVGYYRRAADRWLRHAGGRPLTLHRFPGGVDAPGFVQKNTPRHYPAVIERYEAPKREGGSTTYPVVHDREGLAYLANQGTVAFHMWTGRLPDPTRPDRVVFDLDPPPGGAAAAAEATREVGDLLRELGVPSTPMTTGSSGYHVIVAVEPESTVDAAADFAQGVAALASHRHPRRLTSHWRIERRGNRVLVDWLRNRWAQTSIAPWSLRSLPDAPIAVPITWDELDEAVPGRWTLAGIDERLAAPDPLDLAARSPVRLGPAAAALTGLLDEAGIEPESFDRFRS